MLSERYVKKIPIPNLYIQAPRPRLKNHKTVSPEALMNKNSKMDLFTYKKNMIFIYAPIILILFCLLEIFFKVNFYSLGKRGFVSYLISDLIFLNVVHNVFTIIVLNSSSNMQRWLEHHGHEKFWKKMLLGVGLTSIIIFLFLGQALSNEFIIPLEILIFIVLPIHHLVAQSMGLSFMYTARSPQSLQRSIYFEREKTLSMLLTVSMIGTLSLFIYLPHVPLFC